MPGATPLRSVGRALRLSGHELDRFVSQARSDSETILRSVRRDDGPPTVLVIDQFEEVFTLCHNSQEQRAFLENLSAVLKVGTGYKVLITIREDYTPLIARDPHLHKRFERDQIRLGPLSAKSLTDVIRRPADEVGLRFEPGIVEDLVAQVLGDPAALPLLQFTLYELWKSRVRNVVSWDAYKRLGGPLAAIARRAEELFGSLSFEEQTTARRVLIRLARFGETLEVTSRRVLLSELHRLEDPTRVDRVIQRFAEARLLRITKLEPDGTTVEVAHEALVRNWPRLVEWLENARSETRQRLRLTSAAEHWAMHERDPGGLLGGTLLDEAEKYEDLSPVESEFVSESLNARYHRVRWHKWRQRALGVGAAAVVSIILLVGALKYQAFDHRMRAFTKAHAFAKSDESTDYRLRILLLLAAASQAHDLWDSGRFRASVINTLAELLPRAPVYGGIYTSSGMSADGTEIAFLREDGSVTVVNLASNKERHLDQAIGPAGPLDSFSNVGFVDQLGVVVYRGGILHHWQTGKLAQIYLKPLLAPEMQELFQRQFPVVDIANNSVRVVFWNSGETETEMRFASLNYLQISDPKTPRPPLTVVKLRTDRRIPVYSDSSNLFAYAETLGGRSSSSPVKPFLAVGSFDGKLKTAELALDPGWLEGGTVPSFTFIRGENAILLRPSRTTLRTVSITTEGQSLALKPNDVTIKIPDSLGTGPVQTPWAFARPLLASSQAMNGWRAAWVAPSGISVLGFDHQSGFPVPDLNRALLTGFEGGSRLNFGASGRFLLLQQGAWGATTRVRVWDLQLNKAYFQNLPFDQLKELACKAAATGSATRTAILTTSERSQHLDGATVQPCVAAATDAAAARSTFMDRLGRLFRISS